MKTFDPKYADLFLKKCRNCKKLIKVQNKFSTYVFCNNDCRDEYDRKRGFKVRLNKKFKVGIEKNVRFCKRCGNRTEVQDRHAIRVICEKCKQILSKENLEKLAIDKWWPSAKIAKELNFSKTTVKRFLFKYGIFEIKKQIRQTRNKIEFESVGRRTDSGQKIERKCYNCGKPFLVSKFAKYFFCDKCKKDPKRKRIQIKQNCRICGNEIYGYISARPKCDECKEKGLIKHDYENLEIRLKDLKKRKKYRTTEKTYLSYFEFLVDKSTKDEIFYTGSTRRTKIIFHIRLNNGKSKIPDFVILEKNYYKEALSNLEDYEKRKEQLVTDYLENRLEIKKVIECNGIYWHRDNKNINAKEYLRNELWRNEEQVMIEKYKSIGIECLVIWDFQFFENKEKTLKRIKDFCN